MSHPGENKIFPVTKVLCIGNNKIPSSLFTTFYENHSIEKAKDLQLSLYYAPDLDLFNRFEDPVYTPEVAELIGQGDQGGKGIDVFLILISLEHVMSGAMNDLLTGIPTRLGLSEESVWNKAVIAFYMKDHGDPEVYIKDSMNGNVGVKQMVGKAGGRYTYLLKSKPDAFLNKLEMNIRQIHGIDTLSRAKSMLYSVKRIGVYMKNILLGAINVRRICVVSGVLLLYVYYIYSRPQVSTTLQT